MRLKHLVSGWSCALLLLAASRAAPSDKDFTLVVEPLFKGAMFQPGTPLKATVSNKGADAKGVIIVQTTSLRTAYPVELPRGSKKQVLLYPDISMFEPAEIRLDTDEGGARWLFEASSMPDMQDKAVAMISDRVGLLGFMHDTNKKTGASTAGQYVLPQEAPDRAQAYRPFNAVVLGEGSERLGQKAIDALRGYVLLGGTVVFVGGASAPILSDSRWQGLLPVGEASARVIEGSSILGDKYGSATVGLISVMAGKAKSGGVVTSQRAGIPVIIRKSHGLGEVVFLAVNPFEQPLSRWPHRRELMLDVVTMSRSAKVQEWLYSQTSFTGEEDPYGSYGHSGPSGGYYPGPGGSPFEAELPEQGAVTLLLILYLIIVVPVNLGVLRSKRKGELAWITAPIISLAFGGVFFALAGSLYAADLSTISSGVVVFDSGGKEAYFYGQSQMFFPKGGRYDLGLQGVEHLTARQGMDDFRGMYAERRQDITATDAGQIEVPSLSVTNLSFREMYYGQRLAAPQILANLSFARVGDSLRVTGHISNNSSLRILDAMLFAGGRRLSIGALEPGESRRLTSKGLGAINNRMGIDARILPKVIGRRGAVIVGTLEGLRPGPQVGKQLQANCRIRMAAIVSNVLVPGAGN